MTLGQATTGYDTAFDLLLVLTEYELNKVKAAYEETLKPAEGKSYW